MAPRRRKLLYEYVNMPKTPCEQYCDAPTNPDRVCPPLCEGFCPPDCKMVGFEYYLPPPPPPPPPPVLILSPRSVHTLSLGLTISMAVLAAAFFVFICFTTYRFYTYWRKRSDQRTRPGGESGPDDFLDEEHGPIVDHPIWYIRTIGLQPSVISAITVVKYKRGDGLIEGTDCAVCLNEFEEGETLRLLPKCNHAFHIPCVDTWLRSHTNCPMCRAGIVNNAAALLPPQGPVVDNSGPVEENQSEIRVGNRRIGRDSETEPSQLRPGPGVQPMRRSVSMDSSSASMISAQSNRNSDNQLDEAKESQPPMQRGGTCSIKRSLSYSWEW